MRELDLPVLEEILRYGTERYQDLGSGRLVVVGRHDRRLVMIPYEYADDMIVPVTVHTTTRQQIRFRLQTGRFAVE